MKDIARNQRYYPTVYEALWVIQERKCFHCGSMMSEPNGVKVRPTTVTRDHVITLDEQRRKGWHIPHHENVVLACSQCNGKRRNDPLSTEQFARAQKLIQKAIQAYRTTPIRDGSRAKRMWARSTFEIIPCLNPKWEYLFHSSTICSIR